MRGAFNSLTFSMEIRLQSIIVRLQPKSTMHGLLTSFSIQFVTQGFIYWPPWLPTTYCELVKGFYLYILAPDKAVDTMCSNNHWSKPKKKLNQEVDIQPYTQYEEIATWATTILESQPTILQFQTEYKRTTMSQTKRE